jgi:hypothetical protein
LNDGENADPIHVLERIGVALSIWRSHAIRNLRTQLSTLSGIFFAIVLFQYVVAMNSC